MIRLAAVALIGLLVACSAPAAPSPSRTIAAASPSPSVIQTPAPTSTPAPAASPTPIPLPNTAQIDAPSGTVVWVMIGEQAAGARLFRSTDRGDTWRESALPPIAPIVVTFIDDREGWAMVPTGGCCVAPPAGSQCGAPVTLSHTADGGTTWQEIVPTGLAPPGPCKSTIRFADAQRGFIAAFDPAGSPVVYRSGDGGLSWTASSRLPDPPGYTTRSDQGQILGVGRIGTFGTTVLLIASPTNPTTGTSYVYRSTDGGVTFAYASTAPNRSQDVAFVTATRWLQISSPGDSRETTDGGATWHAFTTDYQQAAPVGPAVVFGDAQTGYATARGAIQRTVDGGAHWSSIKTPGTF
jgi:photosystem II stability/assembly factor-like uncharacterized protein